MNLLKILWVTTSVTFVLAFLVPKLTLLVIILLILSILESNKTTREEIKRISDPPRNHVNTVEDWHEVNWHPNEEL